MPTVHHVTGMQFRIAHRGPPLDRWMVALLRHSDGNFAWSCSHRHKSRARVIECGLRALDQKQWQNVRPVRLVSG